MLLTFPVVHSHETQRVISVTQQARPNVSRRAPKQQSPGARASVMTQEFLNPAWANLKSPNVRVTNQRAGWVTMV